MLENLNVAPYGTWKSLVSTDLLTSRMVTISQVRIDHSDTYWVESKATQDGRNVLLQRFGDGTVSEVLPLTPNDQLVDVRTRVHEYGGRAYAVQDRQIVVSHSGDGRLYHFDLNSKFKTLSPLTPLANIRYGDLELDLDRGNVYAVREDHTAAGECVNDLVLIPLDGSAARDDSKIISISSGTDFVSAPTLSPDGAYLAWITWDHPAMPWTYSRLHVARLAEDGTISSQSVIVDTPEVCVSEPRWTYAGDLIHVDDSSGWANLYRTEGFAAPTEKITEDWPDSLRTRALHPAPRAFSAPAWQLGLHTYDILNSEYLVCAWTEAGVTHAGTIRLDNGQLEEWETGWHPVGNIACGDGRVVMLANSPTELPAVVEVTAPYTRVIRPSADITLPDEVISVPQTLAWDTTCGERAHGFFYPPKSDTYKGPENEKPPLVVMVHGGPTTSVHPTLQFSTQFWTNRGFAVLDVNYRGSTSFGRAYRETLNGQWGIKDVADCVSGAQHLIDSGLVDPKRIAIRGASAGGFTALAALVAADVFTAGCSLFGVGNLRVLARETHKFESHYMERLIGSTDPTDLVWTQRSPLHQVENITAPLLILQGSEDKIVPANQAKTMYEALNKLGRTAKLIEFEGEGHGFIRSESIERAFIAELEFYQEIWGIE